MKQKNIIITVVFLVVLGLLANYLLKQQSVSNPAFKVGLVYLLQHPAIDQGIDGFKTELQKIEAETGAKFEVKYSNAFGEPKNVNGIVNGFKQDNSDVIVALTTPCAQIAKQVITDKPVIFVGISDPIGAGLVKNLNSGFENVTGTTSQDPNFETLELAVKLFSWMKKVGILYTATESNSLSILNSLDDKIKSRKLAIQIIKKSIVNTTEILPATNSILKNVDALFLINDNTTISSVELLIKVAKENQKPIFASDVESVNKGALFTYGLNYKDEGKAAAHILKQIVVDKKTPAQIPVFVNNKYYLFINKELYKYNVDTTLVKNAEVVGK